MTVDPTRLLQMLEPTVRPGSHSPANGPQQGKPAFEKRSFDDLLHEAKTNTTDEIRANESKPAPSNPLALLGGFEQVENAALRNVLAQVRDPEPGLGQTGTE